MPKWCDEPSILRTLSRGSELAFRDHSARVQFFVLVALIALMACLLYMRLVELLALPDNDDEEE